MNKMGYSFSIFKFDMEFLGSLKFFKMYPVKSLVNYEFNNARLLSNFEICLIYLITNFVLFKKLK